jgi:hypothetical protein
MKVSQLVLVGVAASLFAGAVLADGCRVIVPVPVAGHVYNGPTECDGGTLKNATVNGPLKVRGTTFTNELTVNGPAILDSASLNSMKINGPLLVKNSTIHGDLSIATDVLKLQKTSVDNIVVRDGESSEVSKVFITEHSTVKGNITFTNKAGEVFLEPNSKIKGKVKNGTLAHLKA